MREETKHGQQIYRLPPCPAYDVEGMESWLSDKAQSGWFLVKDGFSAGIATFEQGEPSLAKYRLDAVQKSTNIWKDDGGEPNAEQVELSERYAWTYVAKRGDFYIYRSFEAGARELNTDPQVQALALRVVKKRCLQEALTFLLLIVVETLYTLHMLHGVMLTMIAVGTWFFVLTVGLILWVLADSLTAFVHLGKLQKKLRDGGGFGSDKNSAKSRKWQAIRYHGKNILKLALVLILVCGFLQGWSLPDMGKDTVSLGDYTGTLPFATMRDFLDEECIDYRETMFGTEYNCVKEWSDWLAPRCIAYVEHAQLTLSDGRILDGGLYIDYYEAATAVIAAELAKECSGINRSKKEYAYMEAPKLDADYAAAYYDDLHFPNIVIQKGNIVIRAEFFQASENDTIGFEEWVRILADSIA